MAGVEIVGIIAAASQFADIGWRVFLGLSRICSDVQQASQKLRNVTLRVGQTIEVVELVRRQHAVTTLPLRQIDAILLELLQSGFEEANRLQTIVDELSTSLGDTKFKRVLKMVMSSKKEDDIIEGCQILANLKIDIMSCLGQETIALMHAQENRIALMQLRLESLAVDNDTYLSTLTDQGTDLGESLNSTARVVEQTQSKSILMLESMDSQLRAQALSSLHISEALVSFPQKLNALETTTTSSATAINNIERLCKGLCATMAEVQYSQNRSSLSWKEACSIVTSKPNFQCEIYDTILQTSDSSAYPLFTRPLEPRICECRKPHKCKGEIGLFGWGKAFWTTSVKHAAGCRYYRSSSLSIEAKVTLMVLWRALQFSISATLGAGGSSIAPEFAITKIVDRKTSPAFLLMDSIESRCAVRIILHRNFKKETRIYSDGNDSLYALEWDRRTLPIILESSLRELRVLYDMGHSHPLDTDPDGRTLLHEVMIMAGRIADPSNETEVLLRQFLVYLTRNGAVKDSSANGIYGKNQSISLLRSNNDIVRYEHLDRDERRTPEGLASFDIRTRCLMDNPAPGLEFYETIADCGWEISTKIFRHSSMGSMYFARALRHLPSLAADLGYNLLSLAVVKRDSEQLKRLLNEGHNPNVGWKHPSLAADVEPVNTQWDPKESDSHSGTPASMARLPPLALALEWEEGAEMLLCAGADPLSAFKRFEQSHPSKPLTQTLKALLRHDIPLSASIPSSRNCVGRLIMFSTQHDEVLLAFARLLVDQRRRLKSRALRELSNLEARSFNLAEDDGVLPDSVASQICTSLLPKGLMPWDRIWVSQNDSHHWVYTDIYHWSCSYMQPQVADILYQAGLRDIDRGSCDLLRCPRYTQSSELFPTPLLSSLEGGNYEMAYWLLRRGVRDITYDGKDIPLLTILSGMDVAASLVRLGASGLIRMLVENTGINPHDGCNCFCSSNGCTPISALVRSQSLEDQYQNLVFRHKITYMMAWLTQSQPSILERLQSWRCFFQIELFERLGMAHTCHDGTAYWSPDHVTLDAEEQRELREEDEKAGLVEELNTWMREYDTAQASYFEQETNIDDFVSRQIERLNRECFDNETYRRDCRRVGLEYRALEYLAPDISCDCDPKP